MTQGALAERMNAIGFPRWSRTTVTEVEGKGRGRGITMAELIGVAHVLDVSVGDLIHDAVSDRPIEIATGGLTVDSFVDLAVRILSPEVVSGLTEQLTAAGLNKEIERLRRVGSERFHAVAEEIRGVAGWFETEAVALINETEEPQS